MTLAPALAASQSLENTFATLVGGTGGVLPGAAGQLGVNLGGTDVVLERPLVLLALPVLVAAFWYLIFGAKRGEAATDRGRTGSGATPPTTDRRTRRLLFLSRVVVVACLVVAAAGPATLTVAETPGNPRVTLLVDESDSMAVADTDVDALARDVEAAGVPVERVVVGSGTDSDIGDAVAANVRPEGSLVLVSDGQVTGGRSLESAAEVARGANATVSTVDLDVTGTERGVGVVGPETTSVGVDNAFLVRVHGVGGGPARVNVAVDGETVRTETVDGPDGGFEFTHAFGTTGDHRVVATVDSAEDEFSQNDVARASVRVVDRPKILYVARADYPLATLLSDLYDVDRAQSVPSNLDGYTAVVVQDVAAADLGDTDALQRFVVDGGGLVVVGGENAFENGDYGQSSVSTMLPVQSGDEAGDEQATVVLVIDVSGSTAGGLRVQKAIALDVLDQLGDDQRVGLVAFNDYAYRVSDPVPLSTSRAKLEDTISRLQSSGGTNIAAGLVGGAEMLGDEGGSVILLSDGIGDTSSSLAAARALGERDTRVVTVGVGEQIDESLLRGVADASGGTYVRADETNRLRILFGDDSRPFSADALTVVDDSHFITTGVTLRSNPSEENDVSVRPGADYLVATGSGTPAVASWQYGLGRVVTFTAYDDDGTLDGLLARPDSLVVTKAVNWAIGDPERTRTDVAAVPDTRVGEETAARYTGASRPTDAPPDVSFVQVAPDEYEATFVPDEPGFATLLGTEYAVNYPREYDAFGPSPTLAAVAETTGGRAFAASDGAEIAEFAREQSIRVRVVRTEYAWAFLTAALVVYLAEVAARRLKVYTRRARIGGA